jgi:glucose/arabinose dehydrogenase
LVSLFAAPIFFLTLLVFEARAQPFSVHGPMGSAGPFDVTTFASGLAFPSSMQQLVDGSLVVLTTAPNGLWGASDGRILRLVDANGDGVADGPPQLLASGLPGVATSLRIAGALVFVSAQERGSEGIHVLRMGATPATPYTWLASLDFSFTVACPGNPFWVHPNNALAVRELAVPPATVELYFNLGSEANLETCGQVVAGGLLAGLPGSNPIDADSIYRVRVSDTGGVPLVSQLEKIASGLRNAAGMAFDPETGDLYFQDNGANLPPPGNSDEPLAADELNRIAALDLGGAVEDFGFPSDYVVYRIGGATTGTSFQPLVAFQPMPDPVTGAESEGPVEIAFSPPGFPLALRGGILLGFHGRFALAGAANEENPVVFADPASGSYFHFIGTGEPALGHPNGLLATDDALYVADFATTGSFGAADTGAIYRIRSLSGVPAASPWARTALAALVILTAGLNVPRRRVPRSSPGGPTGSSLRRQGTPLHRVRRLGSSPRPP